MLPIFDCRPLIRIALIILFFLPLSFAARATATASEPEVRMETLITPGVSSDSIGDSLLELLVEQRLENSADTVTTVPDRNWWHLLRKGELDMRDSTVEYPRFIRFCRDVYLWGDKTFNSYDTTYVVGTGKNWKARIGFDGWSDSYHINLNRTMPLTMFSTPYTSAAIYLHFMAVSINQTIDLTNLCFNKPVNHKKFEFGFNCARFSLDLAFNSNTGGSYIRTFGEYNQGRIFRQYFSGVNLNSFTADLYYYFNNRKYANGAAYNYSKFQKKSAGSFILGFTYSYEDISLDFTKLPEFLLPYMKVEPNSYKFNYFNYCVLLGYGYNWVLNRHLLLNATVMPSVGIIHCTEDSSEGSAKLLSMNIKGRISFTYNLNDFFISFIAKGDGHWYNSKRLSVFNAIENASLSVGVRF
ncbi:MAG: DUF4421 domain-containing protein [Muribaculaceae bacterium]|nr:DUF4421 domain-containing protein [Muribaculaceae bacterium]